MLAVLFAALSGASYGASDFSGAVASKENNANVVTVAVQLVSLAALGIALVFVSGELVANDLLWGAVGGLGVAVGLTTFYRALALGPVATAASLTALFSAGIPVVVGLLLGEIPTPLQLVGVGMAIPAAVLVSAGGTSLHGASTNTTPRERVAGKQQINQTRALSMLAGIGFALFFIALAQTSEDGGLYPLLGARGASVLALTVVIATKSEWERITPANRMPVAIAGVLDCAANSFYLTALKFGTFPTVAAVSSLYPVGTVLLARIILKERLARLQILGLGLAALALLLVALGAPT